MYDLDQMLANYKENFLECLSKKTSQSYCEKLDFKKTDTLSKDLQKINQLYLACLNADSIAQDIKSIKSTVDEPFSEFGMLNSNSITKFFYDKYYVMPKAIYSNPDGTFEYMVEADELLHQLEASLNNRKTIFLSAGVGAGKTTFLHKVRYEFCNDKNIIYESMLKYKDKSADKILDSIKIQISDENDDDIILIIDELDSFSYSEERFIFDKVGYTTFSKEIEKTKDVVLGLLSEYSQSNITIVFSVRPYVMSHFFDVDNQNSPYRDISINSEIYELKYTENNITSVISKRLELMVDILKTINNDSTIATGMKKTLSEYSEEIIKTFEEIYNEKIGIINELYNNATQGFRSIIKLYKDLTYVPTLFKSHFSNNILIIYLLSQHKTYSQILPSRCNQKKTYTYPNMFLSVSNAEANSSKPCRNPSFLTYWLKILILKYVQKNKNVSVENILNNFSNYNKTNIEKVKYDVSLVQLALGSLGTTNEYNCLEYNFPENNIGSYEDFIRYTTVGLTRRGQYIIDNNTFFEYNHFELFIDDWQLPTPRIDKVYTHDKYIYEPLEKVLKYEYSYEYLSSGKKKDKFPEFILNKTKKMIWYTYIFELSLYHELKYYNISFEVDYNRDFFIDRRKKIIKSAAKILEHYSKNTVKVLENFNSNCSNTKSDINSFIKNVLDKEIFIICDYDGLCKMDKDNNNIKG